MTQKAEAAAKKPAAKKKAAAKKPAAKKKAAAKRPAGLTKKDMEAVDARIDKLEALVKVNAEGIVQLDGSIGEVQDAIHELNEIVAGMPEKTQAWMKDYLARSIPKQVQAQVFDMCDTILWYGVRDTFVRAFAGIAKLGKKVGGLVTRETTDGLKKEAKRHRDAKAGKKTGADAEEESTGAWATVKGAVSKAWPIKAKTVEA